MCQAAQQERKMRVEKKAKNNKQDLIVGTVGSEYFKLSV